MVWPTMRTLMAALPLRFGMAMASRSSPPPPARRGGGGGGGGANPGPTVSDFDVSESLSAASGRTPHPQPLSPKGRGEQENRPLTQNNSGIGRPSLAK